ncbi:MAG: hypothetical protein BGO55_23175 [Sphingobacteriales bacterium 50-39]|nr:MAG: hypothetical protein BGO55_23175 [Sphingobacteriales bacterium 50-39]
MIVKKLSRKYLMLVGVIIITIVFFIAVRMRPFCLDVIVRGFSRIHYFDDVDTTDAIINNLLLFFFFSIITFYWNVRSLKSIGKLTVIGLSLQCFLDLMAIPVCILIMVIKYNSRKDMPNLNSLVNPFALAVFPVSKHLIIALATRKK